MRNKKSSLALTVVLTISAATMILAAPRVTAQSITVLHRFDANGVDGFGPNGSLIFDAAGNLYGTTAGGGASCGTVFELSPKAGGGWTEKILYNFGCDNQFGEDGPIGSLIFDANGNLYGATAAGGTGECYNPFNDQNELLGCGTVFELTPSDGAWTEKVLHNFTDSTRDGASPNGGLIFDAAGNLYGTTGQGGSGCLVKEGSTGCGTVFELSPTAGGGWAEQVLYRFGEAEADGTYPSAGLVMDTAGNLYGTTWNGGDSTLCAPDGCGTVFELSRGLGRSWKEKVLYDFGSSNGVEQASSGGLIFDSAGSLYGTTSIGGGVSAGTVFELSPMEGGSWTEKVLYNFCSKPDCTDGEAPEAGLILDASGNLYGTTNKGGAGLGYGTVFELTPEADGSWTERVLYSFGGGLGHFVGGAFPDSGLIMDGEGNLYGTAPVGGIGYERRGGFYGYGTAFEVRPSASIRERLGYRGMEPGFSIP
jgi:uncharacterized repeat protein (TIGR03803 family)